MNRCRPLLISLFCLCLIVSCQLVDRLFNGDVLARSGKDVLYSREVLDLLPKGCSPEDSAHIIRQYIDSWATRCLLLDQAENRLSKEERNIDRELEELRTHLLVYRYEMLYVDSKLDTMITGQECQDYYQENPQNFISDTYVITCRYVGISLSSPNLQVVKKLFFSDGQDDLEELKKVCYSSADKFFCYDDWISLEDISRELGQSLSHCEDILNGSDRIIIERDGTLQMVYVTAKVSPGQVSPFSYCREKIEDIILSRRKQELLTNLERNLLNEAKSSGKLIIYKSE